MRTQGSLRLILNTKLWAQMQIDKASEKSIRITAMDTEDQGVKVFLISVSSPGDGVGCCCPLGERSCQTAPWTKAVPSCTPTEGRFPGTPSRRTAGPH